MHYIALFCVLSIMWLHCRAFISSHRWTKMSKSRSLFSQQLSTSSETKIVHSLEDNMTSGLGGMLGIMVRAVSLQNAVQKYQQQLKLSDASAKVFGETALCSLLLGSSMKGQETMQLNFVGTEDIRSMTIITNAELEFRGRISNPNLTINSNLQSAITLFGEGGQLQVIRNHPMFKTPMTGIVGLRNGSIALNCALYLAESEQRTAAIVTDVDVSNGRCNHAMAVLVERLPDADEAVLEKIIANLEHVQKKKLSSYLVPSTTNSEEADNGLTTKLISNDDNSGSKESNYDPLDKIISDCLLNHDEDQLRWSKKPTFKCHCSHDRVLSAVRLLPKSDINEMVDENKPIDTMCDFCGQQYVISVDEMRALQG